MSDGWIKTDRGWRKSYGPECTPSDARSDLACPRVSTDTMDLTEHVNGQYYDSKSQFRAVSKENGLIEVGNDPARLRPKAKAIPDRQARREAIKQAIAQAGLE